jgi:hypothetical protein
MIDQIRKHLQLVPFLPFVIHTSDGHEYPVSSIDHALITPRGTRIVVSDDKDVVSVLPMLHISGVIHQANGE